MWDINNGNSLYNLKGHDKKISCLLYHPLLKTLISGSFDHSIRLWSTSI